MESGLLISRSRALAGCFVSLTALATLLLAAVFDRSSGAAPPCPVGAPAEIHYAPSEDLERIDIALLREATKQIDMATYVLTDRAVVDALREAAGRGVKVRIWRDASEAARLGDFDVEARLGRRPQGIGLRSSAPGGELMHLKGYCVDHRLLRTGSANFSRSGETRQDNDLVALRGASVCAGFDAKFNRAWARG
jgi:phosphatidylserine/phosphatidylglycerophosphate/cardiolipin synthase-like enzyme